MTEIKRKRNVSIDNLTESQLEKLSVDLGKKIAKMYDDVAKEANKLLDIYGMEVELSYNIKPKSK